MLKRLIYISTNYEVYTNIQSTKNSEVRTHAYGGAGKITNLRNTKHGEVRIKIEKGGKNEYILRQKNNENNLIVNPTIY